MENLKQLIVVSLAFLTLLYLEEIADVLNLSLFGIAIAKTMLLIAIGMVIYIYHPEALRKALFGRPKNMLLLLLLIPNLLLYSSGFDVQAISKAVSADYHESLFQFQRIFLNAALEEFMFRILVFYALLSVLKDSKHQIMTAVILSSIVFGVVHLNNTETIGLRASLLQSYGAFAAGFLFSILYLKTNNILTLTIAHFIINYAAHFAPTNSTVTTSDATGSSNSIVSLIITLIVFALPLVIGLLILKYHRDKEFYIYPNYPKKAYSPVP